MQPRRERGQSRHAVVWSYRSRAGRESEFIAEYGSRGSWARLFARSPDFLETELLHPAEAGGAYLVIDLWRTAEGRSRFLAGFQAEYDALSQRLSVLWTEEANLGSFETPGNFEELPSPAAADATKELDALVRELRPNLHEAPYVFLTMTEESGPLLELALASFREEEGLTLVLERDAATALGREAGSLWARITLEVNSSLHAVGLLALVSSALAEAGIACNPISAWFHDHLFVPWPERQRALEALQALPARGA
jgi:uncharacterized protein